MAVVDGSAISRQSGKATDMSAAKGQEMGSKQFAWGPSSPGGKVEDRAPAPECD